MPLLIETSVQNEQVRWRPYYLSRIELFAGGITLAAAFGYAIGGSTGGTLAGLGFPLSSSPTRFAVGARLVFGFSASGSARRCPD